MAAPYDRKGLADLVGREGAGCQAEEVTGFGLGWSGWAGGGAGHVFVSRARCASLDQGAEDAKVLEWNCIQQ